MFKSSAFHLKSFKIVSLYPNERTPLQSLELPFLSCLIMSVSVSKWKVQNMIVWKFEQLIFDGSLGAHSRIIVLKMLVIVISLLYHMCFSLHGEFSLSDLSGWEFCFHIVF